MRRRKVSNWAVRAKNKGEALKKFRRWQRGLKQTTRWVATGKVTGPFTYKHGKGGRTKIKPGRQQFYHVHYRRQRG